jgi:hypothetical protein
MWGIPFSHKMIFPVLHLPARRGADGIAGDIPSASGPPEGGCKSGQLSTADGEERLYPQKAKAG